MGRLLSIALFAFVSAKSPITDVFHADCPFAHNEAIVVLWLWNDAGFFADRNTPYLCFLCFAFLFVSFISPCWFVLLLPRSFFVHNLRRCVACVVDCAQSHTVDAIHPF